VQIWKKTRASLLAGETVLGHFAPAGASYEVPAALSWSAEDGARLELAEQRADWPHELRDSSYTVHGRTRDGDELTLLDAWTKARTMGERAKRVRSATLALGQHTDPSERWPRAIYSTTNQGEWRADTGLHYERPEPGLWDRLRRREPEARFRVELRRPTRDEISLPGVQLAFDGEPDAAVVYGPEWSVSTRQGARSQRPGAGARE